MNKNKQTLLKAKAVDDKQATNILIIKIPFEKNSYLEEKILPMLQVIMVRDCDVEQKVNDYKYYPVRIAIVQASKGSGPTTLVALTDDKEMREFENLKSTVSNKAAKIFRYYYF